VELFHRHDAAHDEQRQHGGLRNQERRLRLRRRNGGFWNACPMLVEWNSNPVTLVKTVVKRKSVPSSRRVALRQHAEWDDDP